MALFPVGGMVFGGPSSPGESEVQHVGQGKNSRQQHFGSPHAGLKSTLASGDPLSRSMSHYGKAPSMAKTAPALGKFRGGGGGMKRIRGGLGPGRMGQAGTSKDYSMTSADTE